MRAFILCVALAVSGPAVAAPAPVANVPVSTPTATMPVPAPAGSYRQSCKKEVVHYETILKADCKNAKGGWTASSLDDFKTCDIDIANRSGQLFCKAKYAGAPEGPYRESCDHIKAAGDMVAARCMAGANWKATTINMKDKQCKKGLVNKNGALACE